MAAIDVETLEQAMDVAKADIESYSALESVAMTKRSDANQAASASATAKTKALSSIAALVGLLAEVQANNPAAPDPLEDMGELASKNKTPRK